MKINPNKGDIIYVLTRQEHKTLYREMICTKVWFSTFAARDKRGRMHRFWRDSQKEIDDNNHWATLEKPEGERFELVT